MRVPLTRDMTYDSVRTGLLFAVVGAMIGAVAAFVVPSGVGPPSLGAFVALGFFAGLIIWMASLWAALCFFVVRDVARWLGGRR